MKPADLLVLVEFSAWSEVLQGFGDDGLVSVHRPHVEAEVELVDGQVVLTCVVLQNACWIVKCV